MYYLTAELSGREVSCCIVYYIVVFHVEHEMSELFCLVFMQIPYLIDIFV